MLPQAEAPAHSPTSAAPAARHDDGTAPDDGRLTLNDDGPANDDRSTYDDVAARHGNDAVITMITSFIYSTIYIKDHIPLIFKMHYNV